jgi:uncharacterized protein (TIGR00159 family)
MGKLGGWMELRWWDLLDVALVAAFLWATFVWLRQSRARLAFVGLALLGAVFLAARGLQLQLTAWILQGFFAVLVILVVVVFQEDLRLLFERLAVWGLRRRTPSPSTDAADMLARVVARLALWRTGALIVVPGRDPLDRHLEGGVELGGRLSEPLLLSIFDVTSPGHDGAVVVHGDRVTHFAVHLPLSSDQAQLGHLGTRHAACLGLAERCDALCIVVSEERGTVSVARDGRLRTLPRPEEVGAEIARFLEYLAPPVRRNGPWPPLVSQWREGLAALAVSSVLWVVLVPGSSVVDTVRQVPVVVENLPRGWVLDGIEPEQVEVKLSGRRRSLYFSDPAAVRLRVDALLVELGRRTFEVSPDHVQHPEGVEVLEVKPTQVKLSVHRAGTEAADRS